MYTRDVFSGKIKKWRFFKSIGEMMDCPWPGAPETTLTGKPCQAQKIAYLLSRFKLPGSAVLVTHGQTAIVAGPPYPKSGVRPIKASSTALPSYHCFPPSSWQANIRATGPHFALGPAIYPGAPGTHGQSPNLFAFHCSFTRLPKL